MCRHFNVIGIFFLHSVKFWIPEGTKRGLRWIHLVARTNFVEQLADVGE
jgi:hypothetical protein